MSLVRLRAIWITNRRPSVLWHCWLGHLTCKKHRLRNDLNCVEWDVKPCSTNQPSTHPTNWSTQSWNTDWDPTDVGRLWPPNIPTAMKIANRDKATGGRIRHCWGMDVPMATFCRQQCTSVSTTRHYRMWHSTTVSSWTQNILVPTVIPIYCVLVCCGLRFVVVLAVFT